MEFHFKFETPESFKTSHLEILNNSVIISKIIKELQYAFSSTSFLGN